MKKIRIIIIIAILINIAIITYLLYKATNKKVVDYETGPKYITTEEESKIYPEYLYQFVCKYSGKTDLEVLYMKLYEMIHYLDTLGANTSSMENTEIEQYYSNHNKEVAEKTGIDNLRDFKNLVNFSKKYRDTGGYTTVKLQPETINLNNDYTTVNMIVELSNNKNLKFKIFIGNTEKLKGIIKFIPLVEE